MENPFFSPTLFSPAGPSLSPSPSFSFSFPWPKTLPPAQPVSLSPAQFGTPPPQSPPGGVRSSDPSSSPPQARTRARVRPWHTTPRTWACMPRSGPRTYKSTTPPPRIPSSLCRRLAQTLALAACRHCRARSSTPRRRSTASPRRFHHPEGSRGGEDPLHPLLPLSFAFLRAETLAVAAEPRIADVRRSPILGASSRASRCFPRHALPLPSPKPGQTKPRTAVWAKSGEPSAAAAVRRRRRQ